MGKLVMQKVINFEELLIEILLVLTCVLPVGSRLDAHSWGLLIANTVITIRLIDNSASDSDNFINSVWNLFRFACMG